MALLAKDHSSYVPPSIAMYGQGLLLLHRTADKQLHVSNISIRAVLTESGPKALQMDLDQLAPWWIPMYML